MKVTFENNLLTVVTAITKAQVESGHALVAVDPETKSELYTVSKEKVAGISKFGFVGSSYTADGFLQAQILLDDKQDLEKVKKAYGTQLVAAKAYTEEIATGVAAKVATIDEIFATDAE